MTRSETEAAALGVELSCEDASSFDTSGVESKSSLPRDQFEGVIAASSELLGAVARFAREHGFNQSWPWPQRDTYRTVAHYVSDSRWRHVPQANFRYAVVARRGSWM